MQETEITQEQYLAVTGTNPSYSNSGTDESLWPEKRVSWYDAIKYCNALSKLSGFDTCYTYTIADASDAICNFTKNGYHVPTEAQWEYACRAGSTTEYWWGPDTNGMGARVWFYDNSGTTVHPVATKLPNSYGLYDVTGNVQEWCNDWFGAYSAGAATDPTGAKTGAFHVLRGGSADDNYHTYVNDLRSADRYDYTWYGGLPDDGYGGYGFRIVLSAQ
jgi:formylglycine-generating enzyme required for sulfatase activity